MEENTAERCECGSYLGDGPFEHEDRYRHTPVVRRGGERYRHDGNGVFVPMADDADDDAVAM